MKIIIRAFASFREILGRETPLEIADGSTIRDLLAVLAAANERFREAALEDTGVVRDYVVVMKNQKNISSLQGLDTQLSEGDEVAIFPPVAGG
jgi:molybdopterin synthase sulfur carrier subunit